MRIALWHDLPPGGALRHLVATTARSARTHDYTLFASGAATDQPSDLTESVARVIGDAPPTRDGRLARLVALRRRHRALAATIDHADFDLVVVHPSQVTQAPPLLASLRRTPSVYVAHETRRRTHERGYQPWIDPGGPLARGARTVARQPLELGLGAWDARSTRAATALVVNSVCTRDAMAQAYDRIGTVVHPGVDLDAFALGTGPRRGVLSVGALDPTKGHDLVVDALGRLDPELRPEVTIVFERVDPVFRMRLEEQAQRCGVRLVLRHGLDEKELVDAYAGASVLVAAATREPFGLTPLEAMATGTPVIALDDGGYRETVRPGANGELVPREPGAMADAIRAFLGRGAVDPWSVRDTIVPYWTWDRAVDELHEVFDRAAASR